MLYKLTFVLTWANIFHNPDLFIFFYYCTALLQLLVAKLNGHLDVKKNIIRPLARFGKDYNRLKAICTEANRKQKQHFANVTCLTDIVSYRKYACYYIVYYKINTYQLVISHRSVRLDSSTRSRIL